MRTTYARSAIAAAAVLSLGLAACGSDEAGVVEDSTSNAPSETDAPAADAALPNIVVTTNILGDVVEQVVGDAAEVVTIMPVGTDPHDFQASAQEVDVMYNADALIVNGAAFEEGLLDVIEGAESEGVPTFEAISVVDTLEFGEGGDKHSDEEHSDEEHSDEEHSDEEHSDHDDHGHSGADPHFFTDPMRMAAAVDGIVDFLFEEVAFTDPAAVEASANAYIAELTALDADVVSLVESIPEERRVLVTNHEVFGYFAERYGFKVVGAVIPSSSTTDSASAGELAELAEKIEAEGVPAIFADTSSSDDLIDALAGEVDDVTVVELYSESLGEPGSDGATYVDMVLTNVQRITSALA